MPEPPASSDPFAGIREAPGTDPFAAIRETAPAADPFASIREPPPPPGVGAVSQEAGKHLVNLQYEKALEEQQPRPATTLPGAAYQEMVEPWVNRAKAAVEPWLGAFEEAQSDIMGMAPNIIPPPKPGMYGKGIAGAGMEALHSTISGLSSPGLLLALLGGFGVPPAGAMPVVTAYFSGQMAVGAKRKLEEAFQKSAAGDDHGARVAFIESGLGAGLAAAPLLHAREAPTRPAEVIARPTEPAGGPIDAPKASTPSLTDLDTLKTAEAEKGHVLPEDVPPGLAGRIATRRNLLDLAEKIQGGIADPSRPFMLPEEIRLGHSPQLAYQVIQKGLSGEPLGPRGQTFFNQIYAWAEKQDGKLSTLDFERWVNDHGFDVKVPTVLEQVSKEAEARDAGRRIAFDPASLGSRKPTGVSETVIEHTPAGDEVRPLLPPEPDIRYEGNRVIRSIAGGGDKMTADALGQLYGIKSPIEVTRGEVRVPETTLENGTLRIKLPADAEPYQLAHEIMYEGRKAEGKTDTLPEHDDNLITAQVIGDLRAAGIGVEPPQPGPHVDLAAPEGPLKAVRQERNVAAILAEPTGDRFQFPGAPTDFVQKAEQLLGPTYHKVAEAVKAATAYVYPRAFVDDRAIDAVQRRFGFINRAAAERKVNADYARFQNAFEWVDKPTLINIIDKIKTGQAGELKDITLPVMRSAVGDVLSGRKTVIDIQPYVALRARMDQQAYDMLDAEIKKSGGAAAPWIDNHLRLWYKTIPGEVAAKIQQAASPGAVRPLEGTGGMLKKMKIQTASEALARGGELISNNPTVLDDAAWTDIAKFVSSRQMRRELIEGGFAKIVPAGTAPPDGWKTIDDKLARVYFPPEFEGEPAHTGKLYFDPGAHRMLENMLSYDVIRANPIGRGMLALKNLVTGFELGFSTFHAAFETAQASFQDGGLTLERFAKAPFDKKPEMLMRSIASLANPLPTPALSYAKTGSAIMRYLADPKAFEASAEGKAMLEKFPFWKEGVDMAFTGGLKLGMPDAFRVNAARGMAKAITDGGVNNYIGTFFRAFPFTVETVMKPLFEEYIPRIKLGAFMREYGQQLLRNKDRIERGDVTKETLARQSVDRIEDTFGELNFDNLNWQRPFKTAMQLMFRSVTWGLGTARRTGKALVGQANELLEPLRYLQQMTDGKQITAKPFPSLNPDFAWLAASALKTAWLNTIIQTAMTGTPPWKTDTPFMDAMMARSGGNDPNTGKPNRFLFPGYVRDWMSAAIGPGKWLQHKIASVPGRALEAWNNEDFYGNEVYDDRHPLAVKLFQGVAHALFSPPFSYQGMTEQAQRGQVSPAQLAAPFAGFQPAGRALQEGVGGSAFESYMTAEQSRKGAEAGRRPEEQDLHERRVAAMENARLGAPPGQDLGASATRQIYKKALSGLPGGLEARARQLTLKQLVDGWHLATPEEQKRLLPILASKYSWKAIANLPEEQREPTINRLTEITGRAPVEPPSAVQ